MHLSSLPRVHEPALDMDHSKRAAYRVVTCSHSSGSDLVRGPRLNCTPREGGGAEAESVQLPLVNSRVRWGLTSRSLMKVIRPWRKQLASCP